MKLKIEAILDYDDDLMHGGDADVAAKAWFLLLLHTGRLILHENDQIGDVIGTLEITKCEPA